MNNFDIQGFRCFTSNVSFGTGRLTFLTGQNTKGKSTLMKALSILGDSFHESEGGFLLKLDGRHAMVHGVPSIFQMLPWSADTRSGASSRVVFAITEERLTTELEYSVLEQVGEAWLSGVKISVDQDVVLFHAFWDNWMPSVAPIDWSEAKWKIKVRASVPSVGSLFLKRKTWLYDYFADHVRYEKRNDERGRELEKQTDEIEAMVHSRKVFFEESIGGVNSLAGLIREIDSLQYKVMSKIVNRAGNKEELEISDANRKQLERAEKISTGLWLFRDFGSRFSHVIHVSSKRDVAPRVAVFGSPTYTLYRELKLRKDRDNFKHGHPFLLEWMGRFDIGSDVRFEPVEGLGMRMEVHTPAGGWRNIAELAMGEAQMLRLLLVLAKAVDEALATKLPTKVLFEEPDANLHPNLQSKVVEPVVDALSKTGNLSVFIETHSEYMIRSAQVKVKKGLIPPHDVAINYLYDHRRVIGVEHVAIDSNGDLNGHIGSGFMDEAGRLVLDLI